MQNVTVMRLAKRYASKKYFRKHSKKLKQRAHRQCRRTAKHALQAGREIKIKPRLTPWDII